MIPAMRAQISVLDDYQSVAASYGDWDRLDCDVTFHHEAFADTDVAAVALKDAEVVVAMRERTPFPRELFVALPQLKLLVTTGMRNASIDLEAAAEHGVTVCGTRSPGHATAELSFALVQLLARNLFAEIDSTRGGGWQVGMGRDLRGATLGVIGLGRHGSQVAGFGLAFGMRVVAWSQNLTDERADEVGVERVEKLDLLRRADFVSIHLRLSDRTRGLIGADELGAMKPTAYLVNTSRGPIVDEAALLAAVRAGRPAGAALDVYAREPLPADHPFRSEPRILTTPHVGYVTHETYEVFYGEAVEDIAAWLEGAPVRVLT